MFFTNIFEILYNLIFIRKYIEPIIVSDDWLRLYGRNDVFGLYYKFFQNFGLRLMKVIINTESKGFCAHSFNYTCYQGESLTHCFDAALILFGYETNFNNFTVNFSY